MNAMLMGRDYHPSCCSIADLFVPSSLVLAWLPDGSKIWHDNDIYNNDYNNSTNYNNTTNNQ